jgi:hypothetical protein
VEIVARDPQDVDELKRRHRAEGQAEQRDRYRAALLAIAGDQTATIMDKLGRSRGFVQRWAYAYREGGIAALIAKPRGGASRCNVILLPGRTYRVSPPASDELVALDLVELVPSKVKALAAGYVPHARQSNVVVRVDADCHVTRR